MVVLPSRPRIYFHGLGAECPKDELDPIQSLQYDTFEKLDNAMDRSFCIETGAGMDSTRSLVKQAFIGCEKIRELIFHEDVIRKVFFWGFHLMGYSQGGLIARIVYLMCPFLHPYIATLTTNGTPNMGIESLPDLKKFGMEDHKKLATVANFFSKMVQGFTKNFVSDPQRSFLQYLNTNKGPSKLIARLNDDSSVTYDQLESFTMIYYSDEHAVTPPNSETFGVSFNEYTLKFDPPSTSKYYTKLGFDKLDKDGRLLLCRAAGTHLNTNVNEFLDLGTILRDVCFFKGSMEEAEKVRAAYRECTKSKIAGTTWRGLICDVGKTEDQMTDLDKKMAELQAKFDKMQKDLAAGNVADKTSRPNATREQREKAPRAGVIVVPEGLDMDDDAPQQKQEQLPQNGQKKMDAKQKGAVVAGKKEGYNAWPQYTGQGNQVQNKAVPQQQGNQNDPHRGYVKGKRVLGQSVSTGTLGAKIQEKVFV